VASVLDGKARDLGSNPGQDINVIPKFLLRLRPQPIQLWWVYTDCTLSVGRWDS